MACHVCGCKRSSLQAVTGLAPSVQAQVAQHYSQLPTDAKLCSLCIHYCQPCPFFAAKPAATTVTAATSSTRSMTAAVSSAAAATSADTSSCTVSAATATGATAMTSAIATTTATTTSVTATTSGAVRKPKPDVPQQKGGRKKVLKCITVDQRVDKFGKYGLYNDHDVLRCKPCAKRVDHEREDSITHHILTDLHERNCAKHIANGVPYILAPAYEEHERQPPAATNCQPPTTTNHYQPPTANHQPPPTTTNCHQPAVANCQPATAANRQPPTATNHG